MKAEGGDYDSTYVEGMLNLPLGDVFALRLSGVDKRRDCYIKNLDGAPALSSVDIAA